MPTEEVLQEVLNSLRRIEALLIQLLTPTNPWYPTPYPTPGHPYPVTYKSGSH